MAYDELLSVIPNLQLQYGETSRLFRLTETTIRRTNRQTDQAASLVERTEEELS